MSEEYQTPKLPPIGTIQNPPQIAFENWFEYSVRAQPHHTDYAGIVWHGSYIVWMESPEVKDTLLRRSFHIKSTSSKSSG